MDRRVIYVLLALATIAIGLLVHTQGAFLSSAIQDITGDALYAMMITWWIGALARRTPLVARAIVAYTICATIEFSQLWHAPMLDALRATRIGALVLGSGFDTRDLAAYALGVLAALLIDVFVVRKLNPPSVCIMD